MKAELPRRRNGECRNDHSPTAFDFQIHSPVHLLQLSLFGSSLWRIPPNLVSKLLGIAVVGSIDFLTDNFMASLGSALVVDSGQPGFLFGVLDKQPSMLAGGTPSLT